MGVEEGVDEQDDLSVESSNSCKYTCMATFLNLVNKARRDENLAPLEHGDHLNDAAARHAADYNQNYHIGSDGSTWGERVADSGYSPRISYGENIYWETGPGSVKNAFNWWMNSPGHRANILRKGFTEMGFAKHDFGSKRWRWSFCQVFGSRG